VKPELVRWACGRRILEILPDVFSEMDVFFFVRHHPLFRPHHVEGSI